MKDITKQLEMVARITIDDYLKFSVRKGHTTYWILFSRMHRDMHGANWRVTNKKSNTIKAFYTAADVVGYLKEMGLDDREISDEIEYIVNSNINFVMGNLEEIKELYKPEEIQEIQDVEIARFKALKETITSYVDEFLGINKEERPKHLSIVKEDKDED